MNRGHEPDLELVCEPAGDSGEEILAAPRRLRLRWPVLAAAAVAVALLVVAVRGTDGAHHAATSTAPPTRAVSSSAALPGRALGEQVAIFVPPIRVALTCPQASDGQSACASTRSVPPRFLAAVRQRFPGIRQTAALTEVLRGSSPEDRHGLWARSFTGRAGAVRLVVVVRTEQLGGAPSTNEGDDGHRAVTFGARQLGRYAVRVQASAPSGNPTTLAAVDRLCRDPRLVVG